MPKLNENNAWTLEFQEPGTFIEWCGKKFMVIKWLNPSRGVVQEINEDGTFGNRMKFFWKSGGIKSKISK